MTGGPITPGGVGGTPVSGGVLSAAAAMTCWWFGGRGGCDSARERMLPWLLGRLGVRIGSFEFLLGEAGGDIRLSTPAAGIVPELRWLLAASSLSIWSADTIVWVPPLTIGSRGCFTGDEDWLLRPRSDDKALVEMGAKGIRPSLFEVDAPSLPALSQGPCLKYPVVGVSSLLSSVCIEVPDVDIRSSADRCAVTGRDGI